VVHTRVFLEGRVTYGAAKGRLDQFVPNDSGRPAARRCLDLEDPLCGFWPT
jgi:hypothetical protein